MKAKLAALAAAVALCFVFTAARYESRPRWEYRMVYIPDKTAEAEAEKVLNGLGDEGWEAYAVNQNGLDVTTGQYFFKRQK